MQIRNVGVVGCGTMGTGIVQVCALKGFDVTFCEVSQELVDKALNKIKSDMQRIVEKGKITKDEMDRAIMHIDGTTELQKLSKSDIVVEAIVENITEKKNLFKKLSEICNETTILATNTSSLSVTELAISVKNPHRVIGLHFFNPVPVMKLVEIVRSALTSDEAYSETKSFAEALGKTPVTVKDTPGFIVNHLLIPYLLDAIKALEKGIATKEDIDTAMKLGCNHPMGPLELADLIGLDVVLSIADAVYGELKEQRYAAPMLLRQMVRAGFLGRKTKKGFYSY